MVQYERFLCSVSIFNRNWDLFFNVEHISTEFPNNFQYSSWDLLGVFTWAISVHSVFIMYVINKL